MRFPVILPLLIVPALTGVSTRALAQTRSRRAILLGAVRTVPNGTRFALGTKVGILSVETKGATIVRSGSPASFADLSLGSSLTIYGTVSTPANGGRATFVASRIEIAPQPAPGTVRRAGALKRS